MKSIKSILCYEVWLFISGFVCMCSSESMENNWIIGSDELYFVWETRGGEERGRGSRNMEDQVSPILKLGKEALGFGLINFGNRDLSKWASKIN